ncbi:hypothetical protein R1flu_022597 [Riccia fluitans]|uniref:Uncharacterized protein n=1 Tax=Riccia fluitans TaxID=41844 RepID=A0ABD1XPP9_9MARC
MYIAGANSRLAWNSFGTINIPIKRMEAELIAGRQGADLRNPLCSRGGFDRKHRGDPAAGNVHAWLILRRGIPRRIGRGDRSQFGRLPPEAAAELCGITLDRDEVLAGGWDASQFGIGRWGNWHRRGLFSALKPIRRWISERTPMTGRLWLLSQGILDLGCQFEGGWHETEALEVGD